MTSSKTQAALSDFEPYDHIENEDDGTTNCQTMIHLLKGAIGTGILAMPMAFAHAGYILGFVLTMLVAALCSYGILVLIRCQYILCKKNEIAFMPYPLVMREALIAGPSCVACMVPLARAVVDVFLILYQLGICAVYIIFMGTNTKQVLDHYFNLNYDVRIYELFYFLPCLLIMFIKNLRVLSPLAMFANLLTFFGLGIIIYYSVTGPKSQQVAAFADVKKLPTFIGTTLFALEAVGVILSVHSKMKKPKSFVGPFGILSQSLLIAGAFYAVIGLLGYLKYGDASQGSITLDLPENEAMAQVVKVAFCFAIFISYALQGFVPYDIIWTSYLKVRYTDVPSTFRQESFLRIGVVVLSYMMALAIPNLGNFIELLGALCLSMLGFTFPALIEICVLHPDQYGFAKYMLIKNIFLMIFGFAVLILGVALAILHIIDTYKGS